MPDEPVESLALAALRRRMVDSQLRGRGVRDDRVLAAFSKVARHLFVPLSDRESAYEDHPLPIGVGQTISQPYIVAVMLEALALQPPERILEIGTGSGYVTALLAELTASVFSIERHAVLADRARNLLESLGYRNVIVLAGDGTKGVPQFAPYDAILVSAAAQRVPPELFAQLREGGRMIIPIGLPTAQELKLIRKENGIPVVRALEGCRFVPLVEEG